MEYYEHDVVKIRHIPKNEFMNLPDLEMKLNYYMSNRNVVICKKEGNILYTKIPEVKDFLVAFDESYIDRLIKRTYIEFPGVEV